MSAAPYTPPIVGPAGLTINSYQTLLNYLITNFQTIYGNTVYLGNDASDFQWISVVALSLADVQSALQLLYNNFSPVSAVGAALSVMVALNGLQRLLATYSACVVTVTGTPGAVIEDGVIQNAVTGDLWNLPASVTVGGGGTVVVTAVAQQTGPINALADQLTVISTPTSGWTSVTNGSNTATLGTATEADSALRARQAVSTELPSISLVAGTLAGILAVPGVTRAVVDENYTGAVNSNNTPAHSIQAVVEGGDPLAIATAIYNNKSIGCGTYGSTSESVVDPNTGVSNSIDFNIPTPVAITTVLAVHQIPGGGYTSATTAAIQAAVTAYLNSLNIAENVSFSAVVAAAMNVNSSLASPQFSVEISGSTINGGTADVVIAFDQVAQGGTVSVNFV